MIPIRDTERSEHFPLVNNLIILANVLAFLWQLSQGPHIRKAFFLFGLVPARYSDPAIAAHFSAVDQALPFLTSMFLHGGFLHLIGNMWSLYIFGDNIEDRLGHFRYLFFYLLCGLVAGGVQLVTNWDSRIPTIGASGAIAGVMGAYLLLYPKAKILTLIPIFFFFQFVELPAFLFLGFWFLLQVLSAGMTPHGAGGIAFWAHIGGFVAGFAAVKLLDRVPRTGLSEGLRHYTERRGTPRYRTVRPERVDEESDLNGVIELTPREARQGGRKLISVPEGVRKRNLIVTVPPGCGDGTVIRLRGGGRMGPDGTRGDLHLEVRVVVGGES
jgi:membrane associated rhomboid family serine protease